LSNNKLVHTKPIQQPLTVLHAQLAAKESLTTFICYAG